MLWRCPDKIRKLYPPCDTSAFGRIPMNNPKGDFIVSFSQFRKEKDQAKQILAFKIMLEKAKDLGHVKFMMIGKPFFFIW